MRKIFNRLRKPFPNKRDELGRTELYRAVKHGNLTKVKYLLKVGADPSIPNSRGLSPLHQAAYWGELEIMQELLRAGADPKEDNGLGWTPLHSASLAAGLETRQQVIKVLLKLGANPHSQDKYGWTPADYVELWECENPKLAKILEFLRTSPSREDVQQPNMSKLGLDKSGSTPVPAEDEKTDKKGANDNVVPINEAPTKKPKALPDAGKKGFPRH